MWLDDWEYFKERMAHRRIPTVDDDEFMSAMWKVDDGLELRLWASYRGQTLVRTVRGMMYYHRFVSVVTSAFMFLICMVEMLL